MVRRWFHHRDIISGQVDLYMTDRKESEDKEDGNKEEGSKNGPGESQKEVEERTLSSISC